MIRETDRKGRAEARTEERNVKCAAQTEEDKDADGRADVVSLADHTFKPLARKKEDGERTAAC